MVTGDIKLHVDASAPDGESVCIQYGSGRGCKYWYINSLGTNGKWTTRPVHFCRISSCKKASDSGPNRLQIKFRGTPAQVDASGNFARICESRSIAVSATSTGGAIAHLEALLPSISWVSRRP